MAATMAMVAKLPPIGGVQRSTGAVVCPPASSQRNKQYRRAEVGVIHDKAGRTGPGGESKVNAFLPEGPLAGAETALALPGRVGEAARDEAQDEGRGEVDKRTPPAPADSPTRGSGHHHHSSTGNMPSTNGNTLNGGHGRRHSYQPPGAANNTSQALAILRRSRTYAIPPSNYKYMIMPGNNSQLVLNALRTRKWWAPANSSAIGNGGMHSGCVSGGPVGEVHTFFNFFWEQWSPPKRFSDLKAVPFCTQMLNHLECHQALSQKKNLYLNLKRYCKVTGDSLDRIIPKTFLLRAPLNDEPGNPLLAKTGSGAVMEDEADGLDDFRKFYLNLDEEMSKAHGYDSTFRNLWILKPAAFSNRGVGIELATDLQEIVNTVLENVPKPNLHKLTAHTMKRRFWSMRCSEPKGKQAKARMSLMDLRRHNAMLERQREEDYKQEVIRKRYQICLEKRKKAGWIVQKYIERPLLVDSRKIDIRCFVLITVDENTGSPIGHVYRNGYIRTSSSPFSLDVDKITDRNIHLTNDAVQKNNASYGKFEAGNKLSYGQFEDALVRDGIVPPDQDFVRSTLLPKMQELVYKSIAATADLLNPNKRRHCFELLGYDFMLDRELNVYLIEVNMNPCLELASPYLAELLPEVIEAVVQLAVDPVFPQPGYKNNVSPFRSRRRASRVSKPNQFEQVYPRPYDPSAEAPEMANPPAACDDAPNSESTATDNAADNEAAAAGGELAGADGPVGESEDLLCSHAANTAEDEKTTPLEGAAVSPHPPPNQLPASRSASPWPCVAQDSHAALQDGQPEASRSRVSSAREPTSTSDADGPPSPNAPTSSAESGTPIEIEKEEEKEEVPDSARSMPLHRRLLEMLRSTRGSSESQSTTTTTTTTTTSSSSSSSSSSSRSTPSSTRGTTADSTHTAGTARKGRAEQLLEAKLAQVTPTATAADALPLVGVSPRASTRPSTASSACATIRPVTREAATMTIKGRVRDSAVTKGHEV